MPPAGSRLVNEIQGSKQQIQIRDRELHRLERKHEAELEISKHQHDTIRDEAAERLEIILLETENEKKRIEQDRINSLERARAQNAQLEAEARQREIERLLRLEEEENIKRNQEKAAWEAQKRIQKAETQHSDWKNDIKGQEEEAVRLRSVTPSPVKAPVPVPVVNGNGLSLKHNTDLPSSTPLMPWDKLQQWHDQYIVLHKRMKDLRKRLTKIYKEGNEVKKRNGTPNPLGDMTEMRYVAQGTFGKLSQDNHQSNRNIRDKLYNVLLAAWSNTAVGLDAADYFIISKTPIPPGSSHKVSGLFLFLLSHTIKAAVRIISEAGSESTTLQIIGATLAWLISRPEFNILGNSFIDLVLAKLHRDVPLIFGIFGPENTISGQSRLGWEVDQPPGLQYRRQGGLTSLYAEMTMRGHFQKPGDNVFKPWMHWSSVACIVNVDPVQLTRSHAVCMTALLDGYCHKFLMANRVFGPMVLWSVIIELPKKALKGTQWDDMNTVRNNLQSKFGIRLVENEHSIWIGNRLLWKKP